MFLGFFFYCVFHVASIGTVLIGESDDRYEWAFVFGGGGGEEKSLMARGP